MIIHRHYMNRQVVNRNRLSKIDVGKVGIFNKPSVYQDNKSGTYCGHHVIMNKQSGVFTKPDTQRSRVIHYSLEKASDSPSLYKVSINDNIIDQAQSLCRFNFSF